MDIKQFANSYLMKLRPYKTVSQEIWSMEANQRNDVLKLDWNEATVEPAPEVRKAVLEFICSTDFFHLYPAMLNKDLMFLLSQYANVPETNIQYFPSSDTLHEYIGKLYISEGDKVVILWPSYDNFRSTAEANGAKIIYSDIGTKLEYDMRKLKTDIKKERPKLAYICNPNNPTGFLISVEQIEELVQCNPETLFVIDEAYSEFAHQSVNSLTLCYNNLLVTHTMSKAFALANLRFGYMVSSVDNIDAISRIRNPKNIPTITQVAVCAALKNVDYMEKYVAEVETAREWFLSMLQSDKLSQWLKVYPSNSNFILIKCRDMKTKSNIYYALREKKIYVRQLNQSSSLLDCIRITIGTQKQMHTVYDAICKALFS